MSQALGTGAVSAAALPEISVDEPASDWAGAEAIAVTAACGAAPRSDSLAELVGQRYGVDLAALARRERVAGRPGEVVRLPISAGIELPARVLVVGIGHGTPAELRQAGGALARSVRGRNVLLTSLGAGQPVEQVRAAVEGLLLGGYVPPSQGLKSRSDSVPVGRVRLLGRYPAGVLERGRAHAEATWLARDLAAWPSNLKNPPWLAEQAVELAGRAGLQVQVWDERQLAAEEFGGLLAVGSGSATPPRLVRLDYRPAGAAPSRGRIVLVGKGITYDTGGLSIKPRESMVPMKTDMAAAGAVLAVLAGCARLGVRRPVTGLLPLAENAVGGSAYRPGDVVRHYGGRTVEVVNTDAEGRMVLADALAYAVEQLDPDLIVDLATLTGAATLGLGRRHAALYATDERLAAGLQAAAEASGERVWRMPLEPDYRSALDSELADLRHIGDGSTGGGSITAALFLREFTGGRRWAHLDIAGPARADKDENEVVKGASGYGARLLLRWLEALR